MSRGMNEDEAFGGGAPVREAVGRAGACEPLFLNQRPQLNRHCDHHNQTLSSCRTTLLLIGSSALTAAAAAVEEVNSSIESAAAGRGSNG